MQADEQNLVLSQKARLHLEKYSFPVEMMVALPNGTVVGLLCVLSVLLVSYTQSWESSMLCHVGYGKNPGTP